MMAQILILSVLGLLSDLSKVSEKFPLEAYICSC